MVIGMNYSDNGDRYIERVLWDSAWTQEKIQEVADKLSHKCDEVYVIDINQPLDKLFSIKDVVLEGCRII